MTGLIAHLHPPEIAVGSLRTGSYADTDTVMSAVQIEVAALAAGVRAAHG